MTKSPEQLPANFGEKDFELREDLLKALKQGYTRDYQELIKKYFEALVNEQKDN
jgi:ABC-type amino acid transport substrate-binding protein